MAIRAIDENAGKRRQYQRGDLPPKPDDAEKEGRTRETKHEPARCDARDPGADERYALAGEEETIVSMRQRAPDAGTHLGRGSVSVAPGSSKRPVCCRRTASTSVRATFRVSSWIAASSSSAS